MTEYSSMFKAQRDYFLSGATRSYDFRKKQLKKLRSMLQDHEQDLLDALYKDMRKPGFEAYSSELGFVYNEINHALRQLSRWMEPIPATAPLTVFPSKAKVIREPLGVVLIVAPWNYPVNLLITPLIGAMAAGNCAVLKPSELVPATSSLLARMFSENFDPDYINVVEGDGAEVVPRLMEHRFDHVFFTGSIPVGRKIYEMAARQLIPATLELGGKSPCIVDEKVDLAVAAKRIIWGKTWNAGQTCIAPDYLLVQENIKTKLIIAMQQAITDLLGQNVQESGDYARIINEKHFDRLITYLNDGKIVWGGQHDKQDLFIAPTLLTRVDLDMPVMQEEIFGPILPVLSFKDKEEALGIIRQRPFPLSCYIFTKNTAFERFFVEQLSFGGGCINNTLVHLVNTNMPFGGVGYSGLGKYHGKYSFETFSHYKSITKTGTWLDVKLKYAPYKEKLSWLKIFMS